MQIIDLNQVMIANLMVLINTKKNKAIKYDLIADESFLRHMVLNCIRGLNVKFRDKYGKMVIAADDKRSWRKQHFPFYKANRKKFREASDIDWALVFNSIDKFREEITEFMPYPVIRIENMEADDVIGALVLNEFNESHGASDVPENFLILSGDKDFIQLQTYGFVDQYDMVRKRWLEADDPARYLNEHIIRGDRGDGIPNILSGDDVFVVGKRQNKITERVLQEVLYSIETGKFSDKRIERNFHRNRMLIDLSYTPKDSYDLIIDKYLTQTDKNRAKIFGYFLDKGLVNLLERVGEF